MKLQNLIQLKKKISLILIVIILSAVINAAPTPEGPGILQVVNSSSRTPASPSEIQALGGNLTQLNIFAYTQTRTWQGYYGNITGEIKLDDSKGYTMYDWNLANPSGQIYASASQINFADGNIECYNFTKTGGAYFDIASYEASLGLDQSSADGVNETFNTTAEYDPFYLGITYMDQACPVVYLFNGSNESSKSTYQELLLYDLTSNMPVFTSIIRAGGITGFNGEEWDFQMIVADNGRNGNNLPTTYYFYVALE